MSQWIGVAVLAAGAIVAGIFFGGRPSPPPAVSFDAPGPGEEMTVHVTGAVVTPGLVVVPFGSRVADAVAAAGGLTIEANVAGINLAAPVRDGSQVVVPTGPATPGTDGDGVVSLNSAGAEELAGLPGVGPVLAQRIVDHRSAHGPFTTVEDLLDVPGIGEAKLASLRDAAVP